MAERKPLDELRGTDSLDNVLLQVDTRHFGYFNVPKGSKQYFVIQDGEDYAVHEANAEVKDNSNEVTFDLEKIKAFHPIIRAIGGTVTFTSKARQDPYQDHFISIDENEPGSVEDKIIDAFEAFILGSYQVGFRPYITYYRGEPNYEEGITVVNTETDQEPIDDLGEHEPVTQEDTTQTTEPGEEHDTEPHEENEPDVEV